MQVSGLSEVSEQEPPIGHVHIHQRSGKARLGEAKRSFAFAWVGLCKRDGDLLLRSILCMEWSELIAQKRGIKNFKLPASLLILLNHVRETTDSLLCLSTYRIFPSVS